MTACSIDGCERTTSRWNGPWICGEHWKRYCPPRSARRRIYNGIFRDAKRHGWGWRGKDGRKPRLDWRFWHFWETLIRSAQARAAGDRFDMTDVNKLFGWNDGEKS